MKCDSCRGRKFCIENCNYNSVKSCTHYIPDPDVLKCNRWIVSDGEISCGRCDRRFSADSGIKAEIAIGFKFCPYCGARMNEEEEISFGKEVRIHYGR